MHFFKRRNRCEPAGFASGWPNKPKEAEMANTFDDALKRVLIHEAGYVDHPRDPGGATNMGITRRTLAEWRGVRIRDLPKSEVKNISREEVAAIYKARYWDACRCDDLPAGLDYAVFDFAVNSGVARSVKYLQRIVGVRQDGIIGGMTLRAVSRKTARDIVTRLCDDRLAFLKRLRTWPTFGRGWGKRVSGVKSHAMDMTPAYRKVKHV